MSREFSICINSLHFPTVPEDSASWDKIDDRSRELLFSLYKWLQGRMKTAAKPEYAANRLGGSIFVCCFADGMAMLCCRADAESRETAAAGFFIRRDESLRAAWQLARVQLLFMCAGGWDRFGEVRMTPEEIDLKASSFTFPQDYQNRLVGAGIEMLNSEVPYSFAVSAYPVNTAPLKFISAQSQNETVQADQGAIVINPETLMSCRARTAKKYSGIQSFELFCVNKKHFLDMKMKELSLLDDRKSDKTIFRDILSRYVFDDVWCMRITVRDGEYTELLDVYTDKKLHCGSIPFEELVIAMKRAEAASKDHFRVLSGAAEEARGQRGGEAQKKAPKSKKDDRGDQSGGMFAKFLKK